MCAPRLSRARGSRRPSVARARRRRSVLLDVLGRTRKRRDNRSAARRGAQSCARQMVKWGSSFADIQDKATVDALIAERIRSFREVRDMAGPPRPATARDPTLVEQRRLALEEERREQLKDIARQRYEDSERARQIREHAAEEHERQMQRSKQRLRERSMEAEKKVSKAHRQAQDVARDRVSAWRERADAAQEFVTSMVNERMVTLVTQRTGGLPAAQKRVESEHPTRAQELPNTAEGGGRIPARPNRSKKRRPSSFFSRTAPRVLPPQELLKRTSIDARCSRAVYDSREDDQITVQQLAAAEKAIRQARKESFWKAVDASYVLSNYRQVFACWQQRLEDALRSDDALRVSWVYFREHALSNKWRTWTRCTAREMDLQRVTEDVVAYLARRVLGRLLRMWYRLHERAERRRQTMRRHIHHMLNRKLSRGWNVWSRMAADARHTKQAMSRVVRYLFNGNLKRGWLAWHETYAEAVRKLEAIRNGVRNLANRDRRDRARGWRKWHEIWSEKRDAMLIIRSTLKRMMQRGLSRGWMAWLQTVETLKHHATVQEEMQRMLKRLIHRHLNSGWQCWRDAYTEGVRKLEVLRGAAARIRNREVCHGYRLWAEKTASARHNLMVIESTLRKMQHQALMAGWHPWVQMTAVWGAAEELRGMSLRYGALGLLKVGFKTWTRYHKNFLEACAEAERKAMLLARRTRRPPPPREFIEILDAKTIPEARRLRKKFDSEEEVLFTQRQAELQEQTGAPGEGTTTTDTVIKDNPLVSQALDILGLAALPDHAEALDDHVRPLLLRVDQNVPRKQEILTARKLLKAKLEGEATPQVQLLSVAEALVVRLLGGLRAGGQGTAGTTASSNANAGSSLEELPRGL